MPAGHPFWAAMPLAALAFVAPAIARAQPHAADACEKLETSHPIDAPLATQSSLAECYLHAGRLLKARGHYEEVARLAHASAKTDVELQARERLVRLESELPALRISRSAPTDVVALDGVLLGARELGESVRLDPGDHVVSASHPGKRAWRTVVTVAKGARAAVTVPPLESDASAPAPAMSTTPSRDPDQGSTQRTIAVVALATGTLAVAVGSVFGVLSISRRSWASDACADPRHCPSQAGFDDWTSARTAGNVSTVAFITGGVALAAGAALLLFAPDRGAAAASLSPRGGAARWSW